MSKHKKSYKQYKHSRYKDQHRFSEVPNVSVQRSSFNRSHTIKSTFNSGFLVPLILDEVLPGDTFNLDVTSFIRMATPIFPVMDNIRVHFYFFFCPHRLVWDNWKKFCGQQTNPGDSIDFTIPSLDRFMPVGESLWDHYGLPTNVHVGGDSGQVSALFARGHNKIYNEWFRDENLQDSLSVPTDDGPDNPAQYELERVMKAHDYFTSCLPWPQKGDAVPLPGLGTQSVHTTTELTRLAGYPIRVNDPNDATFKSNYLMFTAGDSQQPAHDVKSFVGSFETSDKQMNYLENYTGGLRATSTSVVDPQITATVNELRLAFQTQKMLERDARSGTRYIEILKSHFGVTSPDSRLQRTEYLGGSIGYINFSSVPQTSSTVQGQSPQGNVSAFATGVAHGAGFRKSFDEHGYMHGFMAVRCDITYQSGMPRFLTYKTRLDMYWPVFADIGEQPVWNGQLVHTGVKAEDNKVFGYQAAWDHYRYFPSRISGRFRSNSHAPLDSWHLAQNFGTTCPVLGLGFLQENAPVDRVVANTNEPQFLGDFYINYICARPMPTYSVPGLIDHF